jgi:hypothetical protein
MMVLARRLFGAVSENLKTRTRNERILWIMFVVLWLTSTLGNESAMKERRRNDQKYPVLLLFP